MALSFDASLRILALQAVRSKTDWEARYRHVCRWFSKTFHTPLLEVYDLDDVFVWTHYYEHHFEEMEDDEWKTQVRDAIETPEEKVAREAREAAEDDELLRKAREDRARLKAPRKGPPSMGEEIAKEPSKDLAPSAEERLRKALESMPGRIEPAPHPGAKAKPVVERKEQVNLPGFAEDSFEVKLGEAPKDEDIEMGVKMPPAPPKKRNR